MKLSKSIRVEDQISLLIKEGWYDDAKTLASLCVQHGVISKQQFQNFEMALLGKSGSRYPGHTLYGCAVGFDANTVLSTLQFKRLTAVEEMKASFKQAVSKIEIETSTQCNRRCHYCPNSLPDYHHRREHNEFFDMAMFDGLLSNLKEIEYDRKISLVGLNEFFMHEQNIEYLKRIKQAIPRTFVSIYSNADYITRELLEAVERLGLDQLLISFHLQAGAPYSLEEVMKRTWKFHERTKVMLTLSNYQPGARLEFQAQFGKTRILAGLVNWVSQGHNWNGTVDCGKQVLSPDIPCQSPVNILCLCQNGDFSLCCSTPRERNATTLGNNTILGNLGEYPSIFHAYASDKMLHWRQRAFSTKHLPKLCQSCNQRTQAAHIANKSLAESIEDQNMWVEFPAKPSVVRPRGVEPLLQE